MSIERYRQALSLLLTFGAVMAMLAMTAPASAHSPLGTQGNGAPGKATVISDPTKSWAIYSTIGRGETGYYRFQASEGALIPISLFSSPSRQDSEFTPSFAVMGPGMPKEGSLPPSVQAPSGAGWQIVTGARRERASFEPFAPGAYFQVARTEFTVPADGIYHLAVFDSGNGGRYGIAVGSAESFTLYEWATIPWSMVAIYGWSGMPLWMVYAPAFLVMVLGLGVLIRHGRQKRRLGIAGWLTAIAGLLYMGSGATMAFQGAAALAVTGLDPSVALTVFLAVIPVLLGLLLLKLALREHGDWSSRSRAYLVLLGLLGVFLWAGWLLGPALAVASAALPMRRDRALEDAAS